MFTAYLNDELFFDAGVSLEELALTSAKLSLEAGKAGSFTFTLYPSNLMYDQFHKFTSYVDVYKKDRLIFSGRVLDIEKGFYNQQEITCEGLLAVFNDSVTRPFTHSGTLEALLTTLLTNHNSQVGADKQVTLGNVTVTDSNNYVGRTYEEYVSTMQRLDDLVSALGGYFVVRKADDGLKLDYLEDFTEYSAQEINFGQNLLDLTRESSGAEMITALIPLGAEIDVDTGQTDEDGNAITRQETLTIASVNDSLDYLVKQSAADEYGLIFGTKEWSDVTTATALKNKGLAYLDDMSKDKITINVSAVDMAKANSDITGFFCCQYIKVKSALHGINEYLLAVKQDLDLLSPANNKMTLGTTRAGFIEKSQQSESNMIATAKKAAEKAAAKKTVSLETMIDQNAEAITTLASRVTEMGDEVDVAESIAQQTADKFTWLVRSGTDETNFTLTDRVASLLSEEFDITALTTFKNAAMDGSVTVINGGAIETGTITADQIAAGAITAEKIHGGTLDGIVVSQGGRTGIDDTEHPTGSYFGADGFALGSALKYDAETDTITITGSTQITWADITDAPDIPEKISDLENDADYIPSTEFTTLANNWIATKYIIADAVYAENLLGETISGKTLEMTGKTIKWVESDGTVSGGISVSDKRMSINVPYGLTISALHSSQSLIVIDGISQFNNTINACSIIPRSDLSYDLGSSTYEWNNIYANSINISGSASIPGYSKTSHTHSEYYSSGDVARFLNVYVSSSTTTSSAYCGFSSTGCLLKYSSSSEQYKHDIHTVSDELKAKFKKLYDVEIKNWTYNDDYIDPDDELYQKETYGLIAEDLDKILPESVVHNSDGTIENYRDRHLLNAMLFLIQDQKKAIDDLIERVERLEA